MKKIASVSIIALTLVIRGLMIGYAISQEENARENSVPLEYAKFD